MPPQFSLGAAVLLVDQEDARRRRALGRGQRGPAADADGALLNELAVPAVRDGGAFTAVRGFEGTGERDIRFSTTFVRTYDGEFEKLDRLRQLAEAGRLSLRVADTVTPEHAADAHRRLEAGGTRGRLVIEF